MVWFLSLYFLATIFISFWANKRVKTAQDFAVAGGKLPFGISMAALFATWFGSETILGSSVEFVDKGVLGIIEEPVGAALCLLLIGLLIVKPIYKLKLLTIIDFYTLKFGKSVEIVSAIMMIPSYFGWIAAQLLSLGILLNLVSGVPIPIGIIGSGFFVFLYTSIGGMWAISVTDFIQTILIIIGLVIASYLILIKNEGAILIINQPKSDFFNFFPPINNPIGWLHWFAALIAIGLGSLPQQDVYQRVMASKSVKTAIMASFFSAGLYLTIGALPLLIALAVNLKDPSFLPSLTDKQMLVPKAIMHYAPYWVQVLFMGSLISAILSTCSGAILAPATILSENILKPLYPSLSDKRRLISMRLSSFVFAFGGVVLSLQEGSVFKLVGDASIMSLVSLFIPLMYALYSKRLSGLGAVLAMFSGIIAWVMLPDEDNLPPSSLVALGFSWMFMEIGIWIQRSHLDWNLFAKKFNNQKKS